jgi:hypothetical protein
MVVSARRGHFTDSFFMGGTLKNPELQETAHVELRRQRFETRTGTILTSVSSQDWIATMETLTEGRKFRGESLDPDCLYAVELRTELRKLEPESLIAKLWNECLGENAIPFDSEARRAMIEDASRHPELKRHLKAWEQIIAT